MALPDGGEGKCHVISVQSVPVSDLLPIDVDLLEEGKEEEKEATNEEVEDHDSFFSPRGVLEDYGSSSGSSDTSSSKGSNSDSDALSNSKPDFHWGGNFFRALKKSSAKRFQTLPPLNVPKFPRKKKNKSLGETVDPAIDSPIDAELYGLKPTWKNFSLLELETATNKFSRENLIGEGGYAEVYKGILEDGQHVAVKRLTRGSPEEMTADFLSELGIIVHVDHPNTAKLVGYGVEGGMHLVLHLSPHGSLASYLQGSKENLNWRLRYNIALGAAEGLQYLHEGGQKRIIHRDIKASNVLLTADFEAQISDFGLAKWLPDQCTHHTVSKFEGTFGYLPPEFFMHGIVDEKTDVYAYGVLLLELITGRLALDASQKSLVMVAKPFLEKNDMSELLDPTLANAYDPEKMNRVVLTASLCLSQCSTERPDMSQVVQFLRGDDSSLEHAIQQQRSCREELFDEDDCGSSKCLEDVNEHMQIALGL